jgi:glycosyltransferase involved in cell wall biosynthesis
MVGEKMPGDKPAVSIITPTYNHEQYIGQCIESVLAQSMPEWEMIIIDDGSTDGTESVIKQYDDLRIRYIKQENIGPSKLDVTYNRALDVCRGDIIAILEGDDFWPHYKLEYQVPVFSDPEIIFCHGNFKLIHEGTAKYREGIRRRDNKILNNDPVGYMLFDFIDGLMPRAVTVAIRKDALLSIGGFKLSGKVPAIDYGTFMELSLKGKFRFIDANLGYWRRHSNSVSLNTPMLIDYDFCLEVFERRCNEIISLGLPYEILRNRLLNRRTFWHSVGSSIVHEKELLDIGDKANTNIYLKNILARGLGDKNILLIVASLLGYLSLLINFNLIEAVNKIYWKFNHEHI